MSEFFDARIHTEGPNAQLRAPGVIARNGRKRRANMPKRQTTRYSIKTWYSHGPRTHSLQFYYNPKQDYPKAYINSHKLSHARKTLEHCYKFYPGFRHEIVKTVTITETLNQTFEKKE